jgi:hypothetical protein
MICRKIHPATQSLQTGGIHTDHTIHRSVQIEGFQSDRSNLSRMHERMRPCKSTADGKFRKNPHHIREGARQKAIESLHTFRVSISRVTTSEKQHPGKGARPRVRAGQPPPLKEVEGHLFRWNAIFLKMKGAAHGRHRERLTGKGAGHSVRKSGVAKIVGNLAATAIPSD